MRILAIEASGMTAGCALEEDGRILGEYSINYGKTHSQTLVPMLDGLRQMTDPDLHHVDAIALTAGPGSFTGLRIGAATVKGMGLALEKPVIAVSTLESLAFNLFGVRTLICPIMDARRQQVYTAIYDAAGEPDQLPAESEAALSSAVQEPDDVQVYAAGKQNPAGTLQHAAGLRRLRCLREACAVSVPELIEELNRRGREVIFLGDGVPVYRTLLEEELTVPHSYAPAHLSLQRAASTAVLAYLIYEETGEAAFVSADDLRLIYLRKPQAEQQKSRAAASGKLEALAAGRLARELRTGGDTPSHPPDADIAADAEGAGGML